MGVQKTTKAEAKDGFIDFKPVVICYERTTKDKYGMFLTSKAHSTTNREVMRGVRTVLILAEETKVAA